MITPKGGSGRRCSQLSSGPAGTDIPVQLRMAGMEHLDSAFRKTPGRVRRRGVPSDRWGIPDCDGEGRPVCRWCRRPVRPPRRTFCGETCVHEWRVRSDSSYVREQILRRDRGLCQRCGVDVLAALRRWRRQKPPAADRRARRAWRRAAPRWEADHILPVADGGGCCGLENYRLLCRGCHLGVTREWLARRNGERGLGNAESMVKGECGTGKKVE